MISNTNFQLSFDFDDSATYPISEKYNRIAFKMYGDKVDMYTNENTGEFVNIENRYTQNKNLNFTAGEKIHSPADVAWLCRSLEDEAVEQAFAVYVMKDKSFIVQHLSTGIVNATLVDQKLLYNSAETLQPEFIYFVHNHPSGNLKASKDDVQMLKLLKKAFEDSSIIIKEGIIINTRSGKYTTFDDQSNEDINFIQDQEQPQKEAPVYSFNKQVFRTNCVMKQITNSKEVAEFLSTQRFGVSDKTEMLILNHAGFIVAKLIVPDITNTAQIAANITSHGGVSIIAYGNNLTLDAFNTLREKLVAKNIRTLDGILVKSNNMDRQLIHLENDEIFASISSEEINIIPEDEILTIDGFEAKHLLSYRDIVNVKQPASSANSIGLSIHFEEKDNISDNDEYTIGLKPYAKDFVQTILERLSSYRREINKAEKIKQALGLVLKENIFEKLENNRFSSVFDVFTFITDNILHSESKFSRLRNESKHYYLANHLLQNADFSQNAEKNIQRAQVELLELLIKPAVMLELKRYIQNEDKPLITGDLTNILFGRILTEQYYKNQEKYLLEHIRLNLIDAEALIGNDDQEAKSILRKLIDKVFSSPEEIKQMSTYEDPNAKTELPNNEALPEKTNPLKINNETLYNEMKKYYSQADVNSLNILIQQKEFELPKRLNIEQAQLEIRILNQIREEKTNSPFINQTTNNTNSHGR